MSVIGMAETTYRYRVQAHAPHPTQADQALTYDGYVTQKARLSNAEDFAALISGVADHFEQSRSVRISPDSIVLHKLEFVCESTPEQDAEWFRKDDEPGLADEIRRDRSFIHWHVKLRFGAVFVMAVATFASWFHVVEGWGLVDLWVIALRYPSLARLAHSRYTTGYGHDRCRSGTRSTSTAPPGFSLRKESRCSVAAHFLTTRTSC